jgi:hypothetical protein
LFESKIFIETSRATHVKVITLLASFLGIDPTQTSLRVGDHIDLDIVDLVGTCRLDSVDISFQYGDYQVMLCSGGEFFIYGDRRKHEAGEAECPAHEGSCLCEANECN